MVNGFASIDDFLGFSAHCNLPELFFEKKSKMFFNFSFFERFSVEQDMFLLLPVGGTWFSSLLVSFPVFIGTVKMMNIQA